MNRTRVIVAPSDNVIALSVIRSLGRKGFHVVAVSTGRGLAHRSRYCCEVVYTRADRLADAVLEAARTRPDSFLICLGEPEILALNVRRAELERFARLLFPDSRSFALALNKDQTVALARQAGIPVPRTVALADDPDLISCQELTFPVVIKPKQQDVLPFKVKYAATKEELVKELNAMKEHWALLLVQERAAGSGVGIEILIHHGKTVLAFQHRRIREDPPSGGVSVCCISESMDPQLLAWSEKLLNAMEWEGVAMVEFKVDRSTGRVALMEVNGRFWGSLPLAIHAGADFPAALVSCNMEGTDWQARAYKVGLQCRRLIGETKWLVNVVRDGALPFWQAVKAYVSGFQPGMTYYIWDWRDPLPAVVALLKRARLISSSWHE